MGHSQLGCIAICEKEVTVVDMAGPVAYELVDG